MKDAFYFSHDSNARHDTKIGAMRSVYGMEGYGWYWVLIEMMREQETYRLRISGKYDYKVLAKQMECEPDAAAQFVHDCINEFTGEEGGLFLTDGDFIWSESLNRRMEKKEARSENAKKAAQARWGDAPAMQEQCNSNAIKERKEKKEIKESSNKEKDSPAPSNDDFKRIFKLYSQNISAVPGTMEIEAIKEWFNQKIDPGLIEWAIGISVANNGRSFKYVDKTIRNKLQDGIKTGEQAKAFEAIREAKKEGVVMPKEQRPTILTAEQIAQAKELDAILNKEE